MNKDDVIILGGGMRNKIALALAMSMPAIGGAVEVRRRDDYGPFTDWMKANGKSLKRTKVVRRSISTLQLHGWHTTPCDAPEGYFWHQALGGKRLHYLLKKAPGPRHVEYDPIFDRSIIRSGWGYVNPTYAPGDVRGR